MQVPETVSFIEQIPAPPTHNYTPPHSPLLPPLSIAPPPLALNGSTPPSPTSTSPVKDFPLPPPPPPPPPLAIESPLPPVKSPPAPQHTTQLKRNNLLDEIKQGRELKRIAAPSESSRGGIIAEEETGALHRVSIGEKSMRRMNTLETLTEAVYERGKQMRRESREEAVTRKVSTSTWIDDDCSSSSDKEIPKKLEPTHSVKKIESPEGKLPPWKKSMLEQKRLDEEAKKLTELERKEKEQNKPPLMDDDGVPLPSWKAAMLNKKKEKELEEKKAKEQAASTYEAKFEGMPLWKRKLVEKRANEKAVEDAKTAEKQKEIQDKLSIIAAMPAWKRELFLEKNPQYREMLS